MTALLAGIISGAFILGRYDLINQVFMPNLMSKMRPLWF